jgi:hypothetical protein
MLSVIVGVFALVGWYHITGTGTLLQGGGGGLLQVVVLFLMVAVFEETLFRGMLFRIIEDGLGTWGACLVSALIFGLLHMLNGHTTLVSALAVAVIGLLFAACYILTRSLWVPIGLHWAWNFFEGSVFGTHVNGYHLASFIRSVTAGPTFWTGGDYGPEGGLVLILVSLLVTAVLLRLAVQKGQIRPPAWVRRPVRQPATLQPRLPA